MKITQLTDLDLSQYKLAYYKGDSLSHGDLCADDVMKLADGGGKTSEWGGDNRLTIALIPNDKRLQDCGGDDWDDVPASSNASGFYQYPKGTIFLQGDLGGQLQLLTDNPT